MTVAELHRSFKVELDVLDTGVTPEILPETRDILLNKAMLKYIKHKYRPIKELLFRNVGFEEIQKRIDDLSKIVKTSILDVKAYSGDTTLKIADLDELKTGEVLDYMFFLRGTVNVNSSYRPTFLARQDQLSIIPIDPFNKTSIRKPIIYFEEGNIVIQVPEGATIGKFKVTYLKVPAVINLDSGVTIELRSHTHDEIIQLAVSDTLEIIESRRTQTSQAKTLNVE